MAAPATYCECVCAQGVEDHSKLLPKLYILSVNLCKLLLFMCCKGRLTGGHIGLGGLQKLSRCRCSSNDDFLGVPFISVHCFNKYFANRQTGFKLAPNAIKPVIHEIIC